MSVAFALIVSDGLLIRTVQGAALPPALAEAIAMHIQAEFIEPSPHPAASPAETFRALASKVAPAPHGTAALPELEGEWSLPGPVASPAPLRALATDQLAPPNPPIVKDRLAAIEEAKAEGLSGMFCSRCSSARTKQNGTCLICLDCNETTGCS